MRLTVLFVGLVGLLPLDSFLGRSAPSPLRHASTALVVLGGCGDLARCKLFPGLLRLHEQGQLPEEFLAVGCGRETRTAEQFRDVLRARLPLADATTDFLDRVDYHRLESYGSSACLEGLLGGLVSQRFERTIIYLALPPSVFPEVLRTLAGLGDLEVVLEKPVGRDLVSCRALLSALGRPPLLVDHYLGKEVVRRLPSLRFDGGLLEPALSRHHVRFVEGGVELRPAPS